MATITKSIAENSGDYRSTWTLTTTVNDIVASPTAGTTFSLPLPIITAKYSNVGGNKNYGSFYGYLAYYSSDKRIATRLYDYSSNSWPANTNKIITNSETSVNVSIAMLFWGHNPTQRSVPLKVMVDDFFRLQTQGVSGSGSATTDGMYKHTSSDAPLVLFDNVATVTLDAPPTFSNTGVTFDTSYVYTGLTTASVDISELEAKYKGYITSAELKIGAQTATLTGDATNILSSGTLSILLNTEGTFTPTITVTDSRGQTATKTLPSITVSRYVAPSVSFTVARTNASGVADDEGTSAVLTATIDYVSMVANLTQPTVTVDGMTESVTWYTDRALSSAVNWTNYNPASPITLYGFINGGLETESSYSIGITPNDSKASGTEITQTLGGAFYTIDFLAGGHGIAFGQPATQDGFECNMPTTFHDTVTMGDAVSVMDANNTLRALFDFIHPVGSYYETSDTSFDPNDTWGGTWVLEEAGRVHVSAGTGYTIGSKGGEATHTLTVNEMPSHAHIPNPWVVVTNASYASAGDKIPSAASGHFSAKANASANSDNYISSYVGGGQAHNNMPPYVVINRWHRTA